MAARSGGWVGQCDVSRVNVADLPDEFAELKGRLAKDGGALLHYAARDADQQLLVLLSERALYLYDDEGLFVRCVEIKNVEEVLERRPQVIGVKVPMEYDLRLKLADADLTRFIDTLRALYKRITNRVLVARSLPASAKLTRYLYLTPPEDHVAQPELDFTYDSGGDEVQVALIARLVERQQEVADLRRQVKQSAASAAAAQAAAKEEAPPHPALLKKLQDLERAVQEVSHRVAYRGGGGGRARGAPGGASAARVRQLMSLLGKQTAAAGEEIAKLRKSHPGPLPVASQGVAEVNPAAGNTAEGVGVQREESEAVRLRAKAPKASVTFSEHQSGATPPEAVGDAVHAQGGRPVSVAEAIKTALSEDFPTPTTTVSEVSVRALSDAENPPDPQLLERVTRLEAALAAQQERAAGPHAQQTLLGRVAQLEQMLLSGGGGVRTTETETAREINHALLQGWVGGAAHHRDTLSPQGVGLYDISPLSQPHSPPTPLTPPLTAQGSQEARGDTATLPSTDAEEPTGTPTSRAGLDESATSAQRATRTPADARLGARASQYGDYDVDDPIHVLDDVDEHDGPGTAGSRNTSYIPSVHLVSSAMPSRPTARPPSGYSAMSSMPAADGPTEHVHAAAPREAAAHRVPSYPPRPAEPAVTDAGARSSIATASDPPASHPTQDVSCATPQPSTTVSDAGRGPPVVTGLPVHRDPRALQAVAVASALDYHAAVAAAAAAEAQGTPTPAGGALQHKTMSPPPPAAERTASGSVRDAGWTVYECVGGGVVVHTAPGAGAARLAAVRPGERVAVAGTTVDREGCVWAQLAVGGWCSVAGGAGGGQLVPVPPQGHHGPRDGDDTDAAPARPAPRAAGGTPPREQRRGGRGGAHAQSSSSRRVPGKQPQPSLRPSSQPRGPRRAPSARAGGRRPQVRQVDAVHPSHDEDAEEEAHHVQRLEERVAALHTAVLRHHAAVSDSWAMGTGAGESRARSPRRQAAPMPPPLTAPVHAPAPHELQYTVSSYAPAPHPESRHISPTRLRYPGESDTVDAPHAPPAALPEAVGVVGGAAAGDSGTARREPTTLVSTAQEELRLRKKAQDARTGGALAPRTAKLSRHTAASPSRQRRPVFR